MNIKNIKLINFRNHANYVLDCKKDTTLILGENGCGKTSVLEAIYILTRGKSFRATDPDIIKRGADFYRIELEFDRGEKTTAIYDGKNKYFHTSDKKTKRLPKDQKHPVILFLPSDLNLISHSPGRRRDYFDRVFSDLNEQYGQNLSRYEKALRQRNEVLKKDFIKKEDLFTWDLLLTKYGTYIHNERKKNTEIINKLITNMYYSIAKTPDQIKILYKTEVKKLDENNYLKQLGDSYEKDKILKHTSFGTHRDDYIFDFNNKVADGSASRGETRSIIIALKFIEAKLLNDSHHQKPIILLDDVFSELDPVRRQSLVDNFKDHQVIITSVEEDKINK